MTLTFCARVLALLAFWPGVALAAGNEPAAPSAAGPAPAAASPPLAAAPASTPLPAGPPVAAVSAAPAAADAKAPAAALNDTQRFCQNIAAAAADARFAWQRKQLSDLDAQIKQRIADLEARQASLKETLAHRDDVLKRAADTIVAIYAKMKPDAAALQLAALDDELASAVLSQLSQKQASAILTEIPSERAAKLITAITATAALGPKKS